MESCVNQGLVASREDIIEILKKEQGKNGDDARFLIKQKVKAAIPSSVGLRDCLKSITHRFHWGKEKMYFMILLSLIMLIIALGFYALDVSTDVLYTNDMFIKVQKNFTEEKIQCRANFDKEFNKAIQDCKTDFDPSICSGTMSLAKKTLKDCFENGERFAIPDEWLSAGIVSAVHIGLTVVISFIIWGAFDFGKECGSASIFHLPIPIITRFYRFLCDISLYKHFAKTERYKNQEKEKTYEAELKKITDKISAYENILNLSLIIEASVESSFQFFFQTTFILPTIILAITDPNRGFEWTDLFNFRFFSIGLSFASFSFSFFKIRYLNCQF